MGIAEPQETRFEIARGCYQVEVSIGGAQALHGMPQCVAAEIKSDS